MVREIEYVGRYGRVVWLPVWMQPNSHSIPRGINNEKQKAENKYKL
jgi:hypothetical protein